MEIPINHRAIQSRFDQGSYRTEIPPLTIKWKLPMPKGATGRPRGRPPGSKSRLTREHEAITAEAFESLTEEQIQALKPIDLFRLVALTAVRQRNIPLILKAAVDWAPYEHAKLAPLAVELPQEAEEDRARRLHAALREMRETVGDRRQ